jgi:thiol-disulfide isomerase/thioredoxin/sugar lactone lactonase YvrE
MRNRRLMVGALVTVLVILIGTHVFAQDKASPFMGDPKYPAPEFPTGMDWINVPAPLTLQQLKGKVVLLDFWTYGCINCIHMIPVLEQLEAKYGDALAVVGVHSAKFENEGKTNNLREIVQRYGLKHPVINDAAFTVWNTYRPYGVNAWPTFAVIDPRGNMYAVQAGEIPFEAFDKVIGGMVDYFDGLKEIKREPIKLALESDKQPASALAFPGKVRVDITGGRLFIADSNHNRIVIADLKTYQILDVIGSGERGLKNGSYTEATFDKPQGMAIDGNTLYVADTNNNAVRAIDLTARAVTTIAGTGRQAYNPTGSSATPAEFDISSPWDVELGTNKTLYIAMAGMHQLWQLDLAKNYLMPLAGSGREGLQDGPAADAQLAQPSGLFFRDGTLYFADSESSSIRALDLSKFTVRTLAGPTDNNLFDFGDVDGGLGKSRLQHALGVTGGPDGTLYIADTYNSKIKQWKPDTDTVTTLFGLANKAGFKDGGPDVAQLYEPGGLAFADGKLYVADTNNQAIRVIDLAANTISTITFPNPEALQIADQVTVIGGNRAMGEELILPEQKVAAGTGQIVLNVTLPKGYKLNTIAPFSADWQSSGDAVKIADTDRSLRVVAPTLPIKVPLTLNEGSATLSGSLTIYYCEAEKQSLCFIDQVHVTAPISVSASGSGADVAIERAITPPTLLGGGLSK